MRRNITIDLSTITQVIKRGFDGSFVSFVLDRVVRSRHFMKYLTLVLHIDRKTNEHPAFANIKRLMEIHFELLNKAHSENETALFCAKD